MVLRFSGGKGVGLPAGRGHGCANANGVILRQSAAMSGLGCRITVYSAVGLEGGE